MVTISSPVTADQLLALRDGQRHELIEGELTTMTPAGARHGKVIARITLLLATHVEANRLGTVFGAETGFLLARHPDTVRAPDVSFVRESRSTDVPRGFFVGAPDLAVEVTSPGDSFTEVQRKALHWLQAGCLLVLVVDPEQETVTSYRSPEDIRVFRGDEVINCNDAVSSWSLTPRSAFA